MMGSDEPLLLVLVRHRILYVLKVIVRGQVESVTCRNVIID